MSEDTYGPKGSAGVRALAQIEAHEKVCAERMTEIRTNTSEFKAALSRVHERIDGMRTHMLVIAISIAGGSIGLVVKLVIDLASRS